MSFRTLLILSINLGIGLRSYAEINTVNTPPTVSITSPTTGSSFTLPVTVEIFATASDADGYITKVEFYNGPQLLGTDYSAPYTFQWINPSPGLKSITTKARDNDGAVVTSIPVKITLNQANQAPQVNVVAPGYNSTFELPFTTEITVSAFDPDGSIAKVEIFVDQVKVDEDVGTPYKYSWSIMTPGLYLISAKATDNLGAVAISSTIPVQVSQTSLCSSPLWISTSSYGFGNRVLYQNVVYEAQRYTQGENPLSHHGPGEAWVEFYSCGLVSGQLTQQESQSSFGILPCPAAHEIALDLNTLPFEEGSMEILDAYGNAIVSFQPFSASQHHFGISDLKSGVYWVRLSHQGQVAVQKFIKY